MDGMTELDQSLATPEKKRQYNRRLFVTIAHRYDLITRLLSFGRDQAWKQKVVTLAKVGAGDRVLDLASGTGDLAFAAEARGARVTGLDLTPRMLAFAQSKAAALNSRAAWVAADMCAMPIANQQFDVVTTGYGLRNVPDLSGALKEIQRVLKPGGRLCSLDFDKPEAAWLRVVYLAYLNVVGGTLGWVLHRDPDTYRYIPASIKRYPGARGVVRMMQDAGFMDVRHVRVLGGFMAIHIATSAPCEVRAAETPADLRR
jgi:demethylmenaquinone methyltransferase/2-methoxy-6-polyprenyl-1,4-benzoquinol methylase